MKERWRSAGAAAFVTIAVYASVQWAQAFVARDVHPARGDIRSASDLILAAAFGAALYLWLHLRTTRAALTAAERSHLVLDTELKLAAEVQRRLLPLPTDSGDDVRWAARTQPAGRIGGDFYDFIPTVDGCALMLVGDVSGKGIPASLLQASAHALFRTYARQASHPAELLRFVSREVFAENGGVLYLTCLAVHIDPLRRSLTYVNAGHPPGLVLLGRRRQRLLDRGGLPVGMFPDTTYESETVCVEPGDLGVIVTDGVSEAVEQDGVLAFDRLTHALMDADQPLTPTRACDVLMALAMRSAGPSGVTNWDDDKTIVAFEIDPVLTDRRLDGLGDGQSRTRRWNTVRTDTSIPSV